MTDGRTILHASSTYNFINGKYSCKFLLWTHNLQDFYWRQTILYCNEPSTQVIRQIKNTTVKKINKTFAPYENYWSESWSKNYWFLVKIIWLVFFLFGHNCDLRHFRVVRKFNIFIDYCVITFFKSARFQPILALLEANKWVLVLGFREISLN